MKGYRQFLNELPNKKIVFAFGRFNPPTIGHELLVKAVKKLSVGSDSAVFVSKTKDSKKNPLPVARKVYYLRRMFPRTKFVAATDNMRTIIEVVKHLNKKYKSIVLVAGSDRVSEFKTLLDRYNGKEYNFDSIEVISAGERDPDGDSASGMSATKMREAAKKGNFNAFKRGVPNTLTTMDAKRLMNEVRSGMGLDPIKESIKFEVDDIREKYFKEEIYNVGELVECDGSQLEIVKRGSNHLLLKQEDGSLVSKWLQEVSPLNEVAKDKESGLPKKYVSGLSPSTAKARAAHWNKADKLSDKDPEAYKPAPGDKTAKTKPSKHTKKYKELYGENMESIKFTAADKIKVARIIATTLGIEDAQKKSNPEQLVNMGLRNARKLPMSKNGYKILLNMLKTAKMAGINYDEKMIPTQASRLKEETIEENAAVKKKAQKSGMSYSTLMKVYKRGVAAWNSGHRPGTTPEQWGLARVNSYVTKGKGTYHGADKDLREDATDLEEAIRQPDGTTKVGQFESEKIDTSSNYNLAKSIMSYKDLKRLLGKKDEKENPQLDTMKHEYRTEEIKKADKQIKLKDDGKTLGVNYNKSYDAFFEEDDDSEEMTDEKIEKIADMVAKGITDDDIVNHAYDDDDFEMVDDETGEEVDDEDKKKVNEELEVLDEVLSRIERIRAKQRLMRTKAKRKRAVKIALKRYSPMKVINKRARRMAVKALKQRFTKGRDLKKISVAEKERLEARVKRLTPILNRIAIKMVPRVRQLEKKRLSHKSSTK